MQPTGGNSAFWPTASFEQDWCTLWLILCDDPIESFGFQKSTHRNSVPVVSGGHFCIVFCIDHQTGIFMNPKNVLRYCGYLAGSRTFKCPHADCGVHVERDGNAARNIFVWAVLRAIRQTEAASVDQEDSGGEAKKPPKKKRKETSKQQPRYSCHEQKRPTQSSPKQPDKPFMPA